MWCCILKGEEWGGGCRKRMKREISMGFNHLEEIMIFFSEDCLLIAFTLLKDDSYTVEGWHNALPATRKFCITFGLLSYQINVKVIVICEYNCQDNYI